MFEKLTYLPFSYDHLLSSVWNAEARFATESEPVGDGKRTVETSGARERGTQQWEQTASAAAQSYWIVSLSWGGHSL